jgi:branched-subunit amino acid transport protein
MNCNYKKALKRIGIAIGIIPFGCITLVAALIFGVFLQILAMVLTVLGFFVWCIMYILGFDNMVWNKKGYDWLWQNAEGNSGLVLWPVGEVVDLWIIVWDGQNII